MGSALNSLPSCGFVLSLRCDHRFQTLRRAEGNPPVSRKFSEDPLKMFRLAGCRPALSCPEPSHPASSRPRRPARRSATRAAPAPAGPVPDPWTAGSATRCPWSPSSLPRSAGSAGRLGARAGTHRVPGRGQQGLEAAGDEAVAAVTFTRKFPCRGIPPHRMTSAHPIRHFFPTFPASHTSPTPVFNERGTLMIGVERHIH